MNQCCDTALSLSQHLLFAQHATRNPIALKTHSHNTPYATSPPCNTSYSHNTPHATPPSSQQLLFAQHTTRNLHRHLIVPRNSRSLSASTCQRYEASETHARLLSLRTDRVFPSYYWDPLALPLLMLCVCLRRGLWNGNMGGVLSIYLDTVKAISIYYYRISRGLYIWCFFFRLSKNFAGTLGFSHTSLVMQCSFSFIHECDWNAV